MFKQPVRHLFERQPHVLDGAGRGEERWHVGSKRLFGVGAFAHAGWREYPPSHPPNLDEAIPAAIDAKERLTYMDQVGVYYQLLYPNILGFHSHVFLNQMDHALAAECVRAYNDWLSEFCSADSRRLIPMMMLPFCSQPSTTRWVSRDSLTITGNHCFRRPRRWG